MTGTAVHLKHQQADNHQKQHTAEKTKFFRRNDKDEVVVSGEQVGVGTIEISNAG